MKILITCPPMLKMIDNFSNYLKKKNLNFYAPDIKQKMSKNSLIKIISDFDGWIIGDDPATQAIIKKGSSGKLKAIVKWGIGIDNIDIDACKDYKICFTNTPNMFGSEVADLALGYVIALSRDIFKIDREIRLGNWYKPQGISLKNKKVALIGYGDIGKKTASRLISCEMKVAVYDPYIKYLKKKPNISHETWPKKIHEADFIVITSSLNSSNYHMINEKIFNKCKEGVRIVNVSRGQIIDERSLIMALKSKKVHSVALDVFEKEPLSKKNFFIKNINCVLGSHNASNTKEAVLRTSKIAIDKLYGFLK
jgi:D-3-phosphoglycerate dehydrogenase